MVPPSLQIAVLLPLFLCPVAQLGRVVGHLTMAVRFMEFTKLFVPDHPSSRTKCRRRLSRRRCRRGRRGSTLLLRRKDGHDHVLGHHQCLGRRRTRRSMIFVALLLHRQ
jgi:hypothetical protein